MKKEHIYIYTHTYIKLNHFAVHLRLSQHYTFLLKKSLCVHTGKGIIKIIKYG